jgi:hypothetical protein
MTERYKIINALLNAENDNDFIRYLYYVVNELDLKQETSNITILTNSIEDFQFLLKIYPNLKLKKYTKHKLQNIFFKKIESEENYNYSDDILTFSFSFYTNFSALFKFDLKNGVLINKIDTTKIIEPFYLNPFTICYTENIVNLELFLNLLKNINSDLDVYIPKKLFEKLNDLNYNKIVKKFNSIMIHNEDNSITSVSYNDNGYTLRFRILKEISLELIKYSIDNILIEREPQYIIDLLVNFPEKYIWTGIKNNFYKELSNKKYTYHKSFKKIHCFKYKNFKDVYNNLKRFLDIIIKLGMILNQIKDVIEILNSNKKYKYKLNKLNELN